MSINKDQRLEIIGLAIELADCARMNVSDVLEAAGNLNRYLDSITTAEKPKTRDGLTVVPWVKEYRRLSNSSLKVAVDAWRDGTDLPEDES